MSPGVPACVPACHQRVSAACVPACHQRVSLRVSLRVTGVSLRVSPACVPACVTSVCPCVSPVCVPACVPVCHWRVPACVTSVCPCVSLACVPACVTGVCPSTAVRLDFSCSPMVGRGWCVSCVLLSGVLRLCGPIWTCLLDRRRLAGRHTSDWPSPHYPVLSMQVVSDTSVLEIRLYFLRHLLVISLGYITSSLCKSP